MVRPISSATAPGKTLLKTALFTGGSVLVVAVFVFTQSAVNKLTREVSKTSQLLAQVAAQATLPSTTNPQVQSVLGQLAQGISFPIIITDTTGTPRAWSHIPVNTADVPPGSRDSPAAGMTISQEILARVERVKAQGKALDRVHAPIALRQSPDAPVMGHLHFGNPPVLEQLRWMPLVAVAGTGLLLLLGLSGLGGIRAAEKRVIWVGMAKETAHQLGTPLSSLMGWVELLRAHAEAGGGGDQVTIGRAELAETLVDMEGDIDRLNKVAQRFSHIGSAPQLVLQDVVPVVREAVAYVRRRTPVRGRGRGARALRGSAADQPEPRAARVGAREPVEQCAHRARQAAGTDRGERGPAGGHRGGGHLGERQRSRHDPRGAVARVRARLQHEAPRLGAGPGARTPRRRGVPRRAHRHPPFGAGRGHVDGDPLPDGSRPAAPARRVRVPGRVLPPLVAQRQRDRSVAGADAQRRAAVVEFADQLVVLEPALHRDGSCTLM
jgi:hypothetical protein